MKKYDNYKDSGVKWIGEIPEHWETISNKYIFKLKKNQVGKRSSEYELLSLTLKGIIKRDMENPEGKFPAEFDTYQEVKKNDFVFCLFDVEETPRTVGLSNFDGMITGAYTVMEAIKKTDSKFLYYFYLNLDEKKRLKFLYKGLRNTIPKESFFSFKTIVPSLAEQQAIAEFLDDKTTKIDQAITIKEKEINLLQERRQILIQELVTGKKVWDGTQWAKPTKTKDSGVDWIEKIPEDWEVESFKNILTERNKKNVPIISKERLSLSIDKGVTLYSEKTTNLDRFKDDFTQYKLAYVGDLVFNSMNMIVGAVGASNYFGCISPVYYTYYKSDKNFSLTKFYEYVFRTRSVQSVLYSLGKGIMAIDRGEGKFNTVRLKVARNDLRVLRLPLPSQSIQYKIVTFLDDFETKINKAISLKKQEIEKLKEYKTVLIDNVVTGKIKVS